MNLIKYKNNSTPYLRTLIHFERGKPNMEQTIDERVKSLTEPRFMYFPCWIDRAGEMHVGFCETSWKDAAVEIAYRIKTSEESLAWGGVKKVIVTFLPGSENPAGTATRSGS